MKASTAKHLLEQQRRIKATFEESGHVPEGAIELCDRLIAIFEKLNDYADSCEVLASAEADFPRPMGVIEGQRLAAQGVLERERANADRVAKAAVAEAIEAKARVRARLEAKGPKRQRPSDIAKVELEVEAGHNVEVRPGVSIRLHGVETNHVNGPVAYDRTFELGDTVAMDSFNLVYLGQITLIGSKVVMVKGRTGTKRLTLLTFSRRNRLFDLEKTARQNSATSREI